MKRERQERPEGDVASESETWLWDALSYVIQPGNTSGQAEATEDNEDGGGERSRAARDLLRHALGKDTPLGRVGH